MRSTPRWPRLAALALLLAVGPALAPAPVPGAAQSCYGEDLGKMEAEFVALVDQLRPAVVSVTARFGFRSEESETPAAPPGGESPDGEPGPGGKDAPREPDDSASFRCTFSGVIVEADGIIVTTAGAVDGARAVEVQLLDETRYPATILGFDRRTNLGVLRIAAKGLPAIRFAPAAGTRVGSWVVAVGNAFGLNHSISHGLVSGLDRNLGAGPRIYTGMIQTTAPINPGDAGGLLANLKGECIGIISSTYQRAPSSASFGRMMDEFSRDLDLPEMLRQLMEAGPGKGDAAAAATAPEKTEEMFRRMWRKMRERRAHAAGAVGESPAGAFGGAPGAGGPMLGAEGINFVTPADTVALVVKRIVATGKMERARLGVRLQPPDAALRAQLGLPTGTGLLVADLERGAPAEAAGVRPFDVIIALDGKPTGRLSDLERRLAEIVPPSEVSISVLRNGETLAFTIKLDVRPPDER
ncbi:MAG: trypsin-like peptidase domain-containing protein [Planctomycetes bacterium]|nr:trypsin-like peptidase domain-containing protein [Planctomycetota bacterium]